MEKVSHEKESNPNAPAVPVRSSRFPFIDNIHTTIFTPSEHQVDLLDAAKQKDLVVCLASSTGKAFLLLMLIKEHSHQTRLPGPEQRKSFVLANSFLTIDQYCELVKDHTDLNVTKVVDPESLNNPVTWGSDLNPYEVTVTLVENFFRALREGHLEWAKINLVIIDECHLALLHNHPSHELLSFASVHKGPRIVGFSASVLDLNCDPLVLERRLTSLEKATQCTLDVSSSLVLLSRFSSRPEELLVQCHNYTGGLADVEIRAVVSPVADFLREHEYRLEDIYGSLDDDMPSIPDPTVVPLSFVDDLLDILDSLGVWGADRAAWLFMKELKKHKDKTPYERHFLLLELVNTTMVQVREICSFHFRSHPDEKERMLHYATPKVHRLLEILSFYKLPKDCADGAVKPNSCDQNNFSFCGCSSDINNLSLPKSCRCDSFNNCTSFDGCGTCGSSGTIGESDTTRQTSENYKCCSDYRENLTKYVTECDSIPNGITATVDPKAGGYKKYAPGYQGLLTAAGLVEQRPYSGRWKGGAQSGQSNGRNAPVNEDPNSLWGIVFVERRYTACILNMYLKELSRHHADFRFVSPNFIMGQRQIAFSADGTVNPKDSQMEYRKQEEVLRRFRLHDSNLLVATSVVEEGVDLPKCNLVVRFDPPKDYKSYTQSKARAKAIPSRFLLLVDEKTTDAFLNEMTKFRTVEEILLSRCHEREVPIDEEVDLKECDQVLPPYCPNPTKDAVKVTLSSAISAVNRYCARLPSDTFTRLVPHCVVKRLETNLYQARLYLPINSPVKSSIEGPPMQNAALAKLAVALETCKVLHQFGELDDNLMPMGKVCSWLEADRGVAEEDEEVVPEGMPRPGTTKRRQYYNKQTAVAFQKCRPRAGSPMHLYRIDMKLVCPIPEEQNIRGRQIYEPASTTQGFGLLTSKEIPEICGFPVFTRSGEVLVKLVHVNSDVYFSSDEIDLLSYFHYYTFTNVLRLEKFPMSYDLDVAENSLLIVPVNADVCGSFGLDWSFVGIINSKRNETPCAVPQEVRRNFSFDVQRYQDAVVMPWYRNLDQPQYFYVAEICYHLRPDSDFPDDEFETFEKYYYKKYGISIQNLNQPLLDVDHTSARLNLLTPRYVNRKGIALPMSSEETKRAKRENLQQKQILVPELCTIHPFTASLWRKAVCLPCILYRLNCLLLAEELRVRVASEIQLGQVVLNRNHKWPVLDFGWSLADVVQARKQQTIEEQQKLNAIKSQVSSPQEATPKPQPETAKTDSTWASSVQDNFTIGTWSNSLSFDDVEDDSENDDEDDGLLGELMFLNDGGIFRVNAEQNQFVDGFSAISEESASGSQGVRYGSPSNFEICGWSMDGDADYSMMDIPGFGLISAPIGGFNIENLSRDLEAIKDGKSNQMLKESSDEEDDEDDGSLYWCGPDGEISHWASKRANEAGGPKEWLMEAREWSHSFNWEFAEPDEMVQDAARKCAEKIECARRKIKLIATDTQLNLERPKTVQEKIGCDGPSKPAPDLGPKSPPHCVQSNGCDKALANDTSDTSSNFSKPVIRTKETNGAMNEENEEEAALMLNGHGDVAFSFDSQPDLKVHPGPSPSVMLQALTMSNANDGINLERLETIGDSFLKHAITTYLFCTYPTIHEGKLSHLRSKQVSNLKLYRLGRRKGFANCMVATKFEPNDNWLPPGYVVPKELEQALIESGIPTTDWNIARLPDVGELRDLDSDQIRQALAKHGDEVKQGSDGVPTESSEDIVTTAANGAVSPACFIPYNLMTQHSIPDKSIADCVEAQIGAYLTSCGPRGGLLFMSWLGIDVLPGSAKLDAEGRSRYGNLEQPQSPMHEPRTPDTERHLDLLLCGYDEFERRLGYHFRDRSYLLQAFTHASYHYNRLTDCYQRLEFLGDAVLDYLITRHLYEDKRQHSPGTLTDLRSSLVNNTIFATLAVRYDFHKYFKALCPNLFTVIDRFVRMQKENDHKVNEEYYFIEEDECEEVEDIEVPKALGDVFESVAGAIYLDSGMSLDTVWRVYYAMMKAEIEHFSTCVPKSPIRELLEKEPETAKFGKPERTLDGKVRVTVEVFGKGRFTALGRNYRIAKCTAAKHALKALKKNIPNGIRQNLSTSP